ncbi:hypothetical protein [Aquisalimonas sp.]|nr:hypothetical protein [Aquisalimonas sp.]
MTAMLHHVAGRHGLGDRTRGGVDVEHTPRDFLTGTDLDNKAVLETCRA